MKKLPQVNKEIVAYFLKHGGTLPKGETLFDVAKQFGFHLHPEKEEDNAYRQKLTKKVNDIWRSYIKQKNRLELASETYKDGKLHFETFKKRYNVQVPDSKGYEVASFTTSPYGGSWTKFQKKDSFGSEEHLKALRDILTSHIVPETYNVDIKAANTSLMVYGSDKHIGAVVNSNSIYQNEHDKEAIFQKILGFTISCIDKAYNIFGPFKNLFIFDLGDALDGFNKKTTRGGHELPQQYNNRQQHDIYVEVHKQLFDTIVRNKYAQRIYFISTSNSNHGGDFEYFALKTLETYLNLRYPFIFTTINTQPINHFVLGNHAVIFGHGKDDEDMKFGYPLTLNPKMENYINDYINTCNLGDKKVSFISGDLHQSAETYGKNFRYRKVLSQYGGSKWMYTNFGSSKPGLSLEVFEDEDIIKMDMFFRGKETPNTGINF